MENMAGQGFFPLVICPRELRLAFRRLVEQSLPTLVVMAYVAAGLSLMFGTRERPPTSSDRLVGMGALLACGLLIWSTPVQTLVGAMVIALLAWAAYRGFSRRPPPPVKPPPPAR